MFSLICTWTKDWANNRGADDLRRRRAHYDVTVMKCHSAIWSGYRITLLCVNHTWLTLSFSPNQQAMFFLTSGKTVWPSTKARGVTEEMLNSVTTSQLMNWLRRWRRPLGKADRKKIMWLSKSLTTPFYVQKYPAKNKEIPKLRITLPLVAESYWLRRASTESYQETQICICISELSLILKRHSFFGFTAKENKDILNSDCQYHCS